MGDVYMRGFILGVAAALGGASAANAGVTLSSTGYHLAPPAGGTLVDFDEPTMGGFTLSGSGYAIQRGDNSIGAAPAGGATDLRDDATNYLSVFSGAATLMGDTGYHNVSLFWGSMDAYNALDLLDADGNVIETITAAMVGGGDSGDQLAAWTNRRVDIASTESIFGLQFRSFQPAFEVDNIVFWDGVHGAAGTQIGAAVPEPASWALMLGGFGAVGGALRSGRRRKALAAA